MFLVSMSALIGFGYVVSLKKQAHVDLHKQRVASYEHTQALKAFSETSEQIKDSRTFLESRIIADSEVIAFLALVELIGREQGVRLITNSLSTANINETFDTLILRLEISGTHDQVIETLALFENLPYQVSVPTAQLTQEGGVWKCTTEIHVTKFKKV